ncbi:single-stranded DNA-binding protein [Anaerotignum sp.]
MNKAILMGRLVSDPEVRYSQGAQPVAVARYTLAVNRKYKRQGDPDADFIKCIAFGKGGEFAEKYLKKGQQISVIGRIQVRSWDDNDGKKHWSTEVVVEEQYFADSKKDNNAPAAPAAAPGGGFYPVDESVEDGDLPF